MTMPQVKQDRSVFSTFAAGRLYRSRILRAALLSVALFFGLGFMLQSLFPLAVAQAQMPPLFDETLVEDIAQGD